MTEQQTSKRPARVRCERPEQRARRRSQLCAIARRAGLYVETWLGVGGWHLWAIREEWGECIASGQEPKEPAMLDALGAELSRRLPA